jgi:hypothetical protein
MTGTDNPAVFMPGPSMALSDGSGPSRNEGPPRSIARVATDCLMLAAPSASAFPVIPSQTQSVSDFFFEKGSRSTALSFNKKKQ